MPQTFTDRLADQLIPFLPKSSKKKINAAELKENLNTLLASRKEDEFFQPSLLLEKNVPLKNLLRLTIFLLANQPEFFEKILETLEFVRPKLQSVSLKPKQKAKLRKELDDAQGRILDYLAISTRVAKKDESLTAKILKNCHKLVENFHYNKEFLIAIIDYYIDEINEETINISVLERYPEFQYSQTSIIFLTFLLIEKYQDKFKDVTKAIEFVKHLIELYKGKDTQKKLFETMLEKHLPMLKKQIKMLEIERREQIENKHRLSQEKFSSYIIDRLERNESIKPSDALIFLESMAEIKKPILFQECLKNIATALCYLSPKEYRELSLFFYHKISMTQSNGLLSKYESVYEVFYKKSTELLQKAIETKSRLYSISSGYGSGSLTQENSSAMFSIKRSSTNNDLAQLQECPDVFLLDDDSSNRESTLSV